MSEPIGRIIEPDFGGISGNGTTDTPGNLDATNEAPGPGGESANGIEPPQIIHGYEVVDPASAPIGSAGTGTTARTTKSGKPDRRTRAGRAAAGNEGGAQEKVQGLVDKLSIKELLISIHSGLQVLTHVEEFGIDDDEATRLAKAVEKVSSFYGAVLDPKKIAIANLFAVAGSIYLPRILSYGLKAPKQPEPEPEPSKLVNIKHAPPGGKEFGAHKPNGQAGATVPSQLWQEAAASGVPIGE